MAEEKDQCGDECVIDLKKLKERATDKKAEDREGTLILLARGTYGHYDDGFSAIQVGNAVLAEEEKATLLLLGEGVYFAVRGQNPTDLGLPANTHYLEDFLDLGGRLLALKTSLEQRGLGKEDLVEGVEIISYPEMVREIEGHRVSVTF